MQGCNRSGAKKRGLHIAAIKRVNHRSNRSFRCHVRPHSAGRTQQRELGEGPQIHAWRNLPREKQLMGFKASRVHSPKTAMG